MAVILVRSPGVIKMAQVVREDTYEQAQTDESTRLSRSVVGISRGLGSSRIARARMPLAIIRVLVADDLEITA